jgi:hypothetical protein
MDSESDSRKEFPLQGVSIHLLVLVVLPPKKFSSIFIKKSGRSSGIQ